MTVKYLFDVFGVPNETSAIGNPYLFTGRNYDSETGLYYYRARYYNPNIGRFLQTDPIGYVSGLNLYTYVGNNPIRFVDPSGKDGYGLPVPLPPVPGDPTAPGGGTPGAECCLEMEYNYILAGFNTFTDCVENIVTASPLVSLLGSFWGGTAATGVGALASGSTIGTLSSAYAGGFFTSVAIASVFCGDSTCINPGTYNDCGVCQ